MAPHASHFRTCPLLAVLAALSVGCSKSSTVPDPLPARILQCETNTATVCGTWTQIGGHYRAVWTQGSEANIEIERFDRDVVVFTRSDDVGPTPKMQARYVGVREGRAVRDGHVTWTNEGLTYSGRWQAEW